MKKIKRKTIAMLLMMGLILSGKNMGTVDAATVPEQKNSSLEVTKKDGNLYLDGVIYYENAEEAYKAGLEENGNKSIKGSHGGGYFYPDGWMKTKTSKYNTSYDRDELICKSSALKEQTLEVCSKTTIKVTGSTKFDFAKVASLELSMEIGDEWSKTKKEVIEPKKNRKYLLESYLVVKRRDYTYYENSEEKAKAASHDKVKGVVKFTEEKIKKKK